MRLSELSESFPTPLTLPGFNMKYAVHISYVSYKDRLRGDDVEYQVVNEYDCIIPAILYYIDARLHPRLPLYEIEEYTVKLYRKQK